MPAAQIPPGALVDKLKRAFGLGAKPEIRQRLYSKLAAYTMHPEHGEHVYRIIAEVADYALAIPNQQKRANCFARSVLLRISERVPIAGGAFDAL
jgi:hypothetical protein